jgi:gas vesicle protein
MEYKSYLKFLLGFTAGIVAGSVLGVLVAPRSGKDTRKQIKEMTEDTKEQINDFIRKGEQLFSK